MRSSFSFPFMFIHLALALALAGCPPPTVIRDGKSIPAEEAARADYEQALKLAEAGKNDEAVARYQRLLQEFPDSELVDDGLANLGVLLARAERHELAVEVLQRLVADHPDSPHYLACAVQLGLSLAQLGRKEEALPTLQSVFDRLPDQRRKTEVAAMLAESYHLGGAPVEAVRWYAVLYRLSRDPNVRAELRQRVSELIDRQLSFVQVREALEVLRDAGEAGFPLDLLQFKLAKIFFHILDFERARATLESFVASWPEHELGAEAGGLLKKIIDRDRVNPIAVGVLLPLTGKWRSYGQEALAGVQLGAGIFDDQREDVEGPLLVIRDTAGEPAKAAKLMEELVYDEHVVAVIGPIFSTEAYAAAVKAQELEVPIITMSGREDIPSLGDYVFRNFLTLRDQAEQLVRYAMETLGVRRFGLLYPNEDYGVNFVNAFWEAVKRRKGEIRSAERYEPDAKNFSTPIKKMVGRYWLEARPDFVNERSRIRRQLRNKPLARKRAMEKLVKSLQPKADFEAIFIPAYYLQVAMIAPALAFEDIVVHTTSQWKLDRIKKSLGRDELNMVFLLGGNGWNNQKVVEWAERYVQGAVFCDGFFASSSRPATRRFVAKFKANFDREPGWVEAQAFDTARIVRRIVERTKPQSRQSFREALLRLGDFDGATGRINFGPDGDAQKDLFLLTIERDQIVEIDPERAPHAGS